MWEYFVLDLTVGISSDYVDVDEIQKTFGHMKEWELVSVDNGIAYFKRPVDEARENLKRTKWNEELRTWQIEPQKPLIDAVGKPLDTE